MLTALGAVFIERLLLLRGAEIGDCISVLTYVSVDIQLQCSIRQQ